MFAKLRHIFSAPTLSEQIISDIERHGVSKVDGLVPPEMVAQIIVNSNAIYAERDALHEAGRDQICQYVPELQVSWMTPP